MSAALTRRRPRKVRAGIGANPDPWLALDEALAAIGPMRADLVLVFAHHRHARFFPGLLARIHDRLHPAALAGASSSTIIGPREEAEDVAAIAILAMRLPGAKIAATRLGDWTLEASDDLDAWRARIGPVDDAAGMLVFADPFRTMAPTIVERLGEAYPAAHIVGGLAAGSLEQRQTWVCHDGEAYGDGGVVVTIGGDYTIVPVVSQGCDPIGEPWTITGVDQQWLLTISNRPALDVLKETVVALPREDRERAQGNLLAGLAYDEYRDEFFRGDFLMRTLAGVDRDRGAVAIGALPRVGQTLQFQLRDAATASHDLDVLLQETQATLGKRKPVAAALCSCTGRGADLFGVAHHDALALDAIFPGLPVAGMFCNGEIGPVGGSPPCLHGFTAAIGLIVERDGVSGARG